MEKKLYTITTRSTVVETSIELVRAESREDAFDGDFELVAVLDVTRESVFNLDREVRLPTPLEIEQGVEPPPAEAVLDDVLAALRLLAADVDTPERIADHIGSILNAASVLTERCACLAA